ncbi:MAG: glycosyltransferase family 39 protein [Anaerolineales bacterium]|nr:glycosyltransferase family 39 protein [Anaerolineales bacterium]
MSLSPFFRLKKKAALPVLFSGIILASSLINRQGPDETGLLGLAESVLTLALAGIIILGAATLGFHALERFRLHRLHISERLLLSFTLGTGVIAVSLFLLLLAGAYRPAPIYAVLLLLFTWSGDAWSQVWSGLTALTQRFLHPEKGALLASSVVIALCIFILGTSLIGSLTPPWSYDALKEHLPTPIRFLEDARFRAYPDEWAINSPAYVNLLFGIGLSAGDDVFPRVIHLFYGFILVFGTGILSRRLFGRDTSLIAIAVMLTVPTLPLLISYAYIDAGWAAFELCAVLVFFIWIDSRNNNALFLTGCFLGLAAGTKYTGLGIAVILGLALLVSLRGEKSQSIIRAMISLALPVVLIAGPWHLKNWLLLENPFFPWLLDGAGWDARRRAYLTAFASGFGKGQSLTDLLLLPIRLYTDPGDFGTILQYLDMPGLMMPFAFLLLIFKRNRRTLFIIALTFGRLTFWALVTQQTRFLLPIFPLIASLTAACLINWFHAFRSVVLKRLPEILLYGSLVSIALIQVYMLFAIKPFGVLIGSEADSTFLSRTLKPYPANRFIIDELLAADRVIMLGDARGYYCHPLCSPDSEQFYRASQIASLADPAALPDWIRSQGGTHLLINREDIPFLLEYDTYGYLSRALALITTANENEVLEVTYQDYWVTIFGISFQVP